MASILCGTKANNVMKFTWKYSSSKCLCKLLSFQTNPDSKVNTDLFRELGVSSKIRKCLAAEKITIPTVIQHEVLPITIAQTQSCVIQSPTGSGKTLTFLIPALQDSSPGLHSLIIVPSRELAIQIEHLAKSIISRGRLSKRTVTLYSGGNDSVTIKGIMHTPPPDIIIGTPKRILEVANSGISIFKNLRRVVLDEVDKLLPSQPKHKQSHHEHVKPTIAVLGKLLHKNRGKMNVQCIASSATVNQDLVDQLVHCGWGKDYRLVSTSQIESLTAPKSIQHGFVVDSSDPNSNHYNKLDILAKYLEVNPGKAMVVIHRNAPISQFVFELRQRNVNVVPLHEYTVNAATYSTFLEEFHAGTYIIH